MIFVIVESCKVQYNAYTNFNLTFNRMDSCLMGNHTKCNEEL